MAAIQDIQNLIAQAKPIPADLQKAALLEAQQQGLDNQALASVFGVPVSMISAAYEATGVTPAPAPAVESAAIERLTQNQTAPAALSPAATTPAATTPSLPDATYNIPAPSLPDYRYSDTSGSAGGGAGGSSLGNYVLPTQNVSYGDMEMTITGKRGGETGSTIDRGIGGGGSLVDSNSSTFVQDLVDQDAREEARDVDYQNYLAGIQAQEDKARLLTNAASAEGGFDEGEIDAVTALLNSNAVTVEDVSKQFDVPIGVVQAAYDANKPPSEGTFDLVEDWLSPTDTKNEFLEDIAAANKKVTDAMSIPITADATDPAYQTQIEENLTGISTAKQERDILVNEAIKSGLVDQGDIDDAFGPTFTETVLEGVGDVLGAGTGAIANVAGNIPVVGGALQDTVEGLADFFKETEGTATVNPITGQVTGTWGTYLLGRIHKP